MKQGEAEGGGGVDGRMLRGGGERREGELRGVRVDGDDQLLLWVALLRIRASKRSAAEHSSAFLPEFVGILSSMSFPKNDLKRPVACTNFSKGRTAMGLLRRKERESELHRSLICS